MYASETFQAIDTQSVVEMTENALKAEGINYSVHRIFNRSGQKGWIKFRLPDFKLKLFGTDEVQAEILLRNANDGRTAFCYMIGVHRFVCSNGLVVGHNLFKRRVIHRKGETIEQFLNHLPEQVAAAIHYIKTRLVSDFEAATSKSLTLVEQLQVTVKLEEAGWISPYVGRTVRRNLVTNDRRPEDTNTVWGVYNIVNEAMRKGSRSQHAQIEKNVNLLSQVIEAAA